MDKHASSRAEAPRYSIDSKKRRTHPLVSTSLLVGNPAAPSRYKFVSTLNETLPDIVLREHLGQESLSTPSLPPLTWNDVVDGILGLIYLVIAFGFTAWIFFMYSQKFASLGNLQLQEIRQQLF